MDRTPRLWWTAVGMTALSGAAGGSFGLLSSALYWGFFGGGGSRRTLLGVDAGILFGAIAGLAVGVGWCRWMIRGGDAASRRRASGKLALVPAALGGGIVAGAVATILLHVGMQLVYGFGDGFEKHLWGQLFGLPAGLVVGIVGALVWPPVPKDAPPP